MLSGPDLPMPGDLAHPQPSDIPVHLSSGPLPEPLLSPHTLGAELEPHKLLTQHPLMRMQVIQVRSCSLAHEISTPLCCITQQGD